VQARAATHAESVTAMTQIVEFMALFEEFRGPSWDGWRAILARLTASVREFFAIVGRGAGRRL